MKIKGNQITYNETLNSVLTQDFLLATEVFNRGKLTILMKITAFYSVASIFTKATLLQTSI